MLFDDFERQDDSPARYTEPHYTFLNRSARPNFVKVRDVLEEWFSHYPSGEAPSLARRFRLTEDPQHSSAFFELFLHELLLRLECKAKIHPSTRSAKSRRPDFLVRSHGGGAFYLEAVLASGESTEEQAARARENVVYDVLDGLDSPNFFININVRGAPQTPPSARRIRQFLQMHLAELDPDDIAVLYQTGRQEGVPRWNFEHDGWRIEFSPLPKSRKARGKPGIRPIGMRSYGMKPAKAMSAIRDAIVSKGGRYGNVRLPYVIAINVLELGVGRDEIMKRCSAMNKWRFN